MTPPAITTAVTSQSAAGRNRASMTFYIWTIYLGLFVEQQGNLRYLFPVVVIKTIWNLAFVAVSVVMLILTVDEKPDVPLRGWISVYALQCVVRVLVLWLEYKKRNTRAPINNVVISALIRFSRILETLNSEFSQSWLWLGGWYMYRIDERPPPDAPRLFWLTLACVFPGLFILYIRTVYSDFSFLVVMSVLYIRAVYSNFSFSFIQKGASDADISMLPKYKFEVSNDENQADGRARRMVPMLTNGPEFSAERVLQVQDAECCICLCNYEDGAELYLLPCNHHFHTNCIRQWLMLKASCPLCKRQMIR